MGLLVLLCAISLRVQLAAAGEGTDSILVAAYCPPPAVRQNSSPRSALGGASRDLLAGAEAAGGGLGQLIPGWEGLWEGLGRHLRCFSSPTVCEFTPKEVRLLSKVVEQLVVSTLRRDSSFCHGAGGPG